MTVPPHHFGDEPPENLPGGLLGDLERRQEDVLNQLDDLDAKLNEVLKGLDSTPMERPDAMHASPPTGFLPETGLSEEIDPEEIDDDEEDFGSAEDWA